MSGDAYSRAFFGLALAIILGSGIYAALEASWDHSSLQGFFRDEDNALISAYVTLVFFVSISAFIQGVAWTVFQKLRGRLQRKG